METPNSHCTGVQLPVPESILLDPTEILLWEKAVVKTWGGLNENDTTLLQRKPTTESLRGRSKMTSPGGGGKGVNQMGDKG